MIIFSAVTAGMLMGCGFMLCGKGKPPAEIDDDRPPEVFITGDRHRRFDDAKRFCRDRHTRRRDVLIILGDAGFNYYGDPRDGKLKKAAPKREITLFCLHGNKENRPQNVGTYGIRGFCGGKVY